MSVSMALLLFHNIVWSLVYQTQQRATVVGLEFEPRVCLAKISRIQYGIIQNNIRPSGYQAQASTSREEGWSED